MKSEYSPESFTHPGLTLREKLAELEMGPKEFAVRTGKPEKTITAILNCQSAITPDMAVKFENVLNIPAHFWLNYQQKYNEAVAKQNFKQAITEAVEWAKSFPYPDMAKLFGLPATRKIEEKAEYLLKFFSFSSHKAWENYYYEEKLKLAFRISLKHTKEAHSVSAWLRQGDLLSKEIEAPEYNQSKFKTALKKFKSLMARHPDDFFTKLQNYCLDAGVKTVFTPCLPKAPISGCTRWINDTPLIQLSGRYRRNDIFWFTFFHEAGHILLHGKKDIFLESENHKDKDEKKEREADKFAADWLLKEEEEMEIVSRDELTDEDILEFAKKFNTHPAVIVGRLQHRKLIEFNEGTEYIKKVELW